MVNIQVPFVLIYVLSVLSVLWIIYEIGNLVMCLWDKHQYKKRAKQAAEWLGTWGA